MVLGILYICKIMEEISREPTGGFVGYMEDY